MKKPHKHFAWCLQNCLQTYIFCQAGKRFFRLTHVLLKRKRTYNDPAKRWASTSFFRALAYCEIKRRMVLRWVLDFQCCFLQFDIGVRDNIRFEYEYYTKNTFGTRWLGNNHNCKLKWMSCKAKTWRFQNGSGCKDKGHPHLKLQKVPYNGHLLSWKIVFAFSFVVSILKSEEKLPKLHIKLQES